MNSLYKSIIYILNSTRNANCYGDIIYNWDGKKIHIKKSLDFLLNNNIIVKDEKKYIINNSVHCITLEEHKDATVFVNGNRSVKIRKKFIVTASELKELRLGSVFLTGNEKYKPRSRLTQIKVKRMVNNKIIDYNVENTLIRENTDSRVDFKLMLKQVLTSGDMVDLGFYLWVYNYYSKTRKEALERYGDERIREGLMINNETMKFSIRINLPKNYCYSNAYSSRFTGNMKDFNYKKLDIMNHYPDNLNVLELSINQCPRGSYFIEWVLPE